MHTKSWSRDYSVSRGCNPSGVRLHIRKSEHFGRNTTISLVDTKIRSSQHSKRVAFISDIARLSSNGVPLKRIYRIFILSACICLWSALLVYRLFELQVVESHKWRQLANVQSLKTLEILGARGDILDRNGRKFAMSVESLSVGVYVNKVDDQVSLANELAKYIGKSRADILEKLKSNTNFLWLARGIDPALRDSILSINPKVLQIQSEFRRYYPNSTLASPIIGRVGRNNHGQAGAELAFDEALLARHTSVKVLKDARGYTIKRLSGEYNKENAKIANVEGNDTVGNTHLSRIKQTFASFMSILPDKGIWYSTDIANLSDVEEVVEGGDSPSLRSHGQDIILTIDAVVQEILEEELQRGQENGLARQAFGIVLDSSSGDILALGQSVRFDPNRLYDVNPADMKNIALQNVFEPGSTFKPIVAAIGLEEGVVSISDQIDCENGNFFVGGHLVRDVHPSGVLSVRDILVHSSNIGMAKIGHKIGAQRLYNNIHLFGFGNIVDINFPGQEKGLLREAQDWRAIDLATISFGQSIGVNILQLSQAYGIIANYGILVPSRLRLTDRKTSIKRIISSKTAKNVSDALRGVIEDDGGTGVKAAIPGVSVFGKTGTAQKAKQGSKGYDSDAVQASFVGFVRGEEIGLRNNLVVAIVVDEPSVKPRWGGVLAAPVFQRVMSRVLSHLTATTSTTLRTGSV